MIRVSMVALLSLALGCAVPAETTSQPDPRTAEIVAFVGATVVPMNEARVWPDHTVLVRGDRIDAVGPRSQVRVPDEALVVDAADRFLMPGIGEMHGHIPSPQEPADFVDNVLFLYVANGVTTVRGMLGYEGQLVLRDSVNGSRLAAPSLYLAGPSFSGSSVSSPEQAIEMVRRQHAEGWDLLKVHPGLSRASFDAMARTARELGMRFGGHVPEDVGLLHAMEMGIETLDHLDGYMATMNGLDAPVGEGALRDAVARSLESGVQVVPTMILWETLFGAPSLDSLFAYDGLAYLPPELVSRWSVSRRSAFSSPDFDAAAAGIHMQNRLRLLKALSDGGVPVLFGTDSPQQFSVPGFSVHRELRAMAASGMSPFEILRSATANVGAYFADQDDFGTIAPGKRADLVLLEANPLDDVSHFARQAGVMVRGRWMPREEIDARLEAIKRVYSGSRGSGTSG